MNACERMTRRLRGEPVDRPPNFDIMMTFAAHFIGQPLRSYYLDHRVLCRANLAVQQAFDLDIVQAISDPYREAADLGLPVVFPPDGLPMRTASLLVELGDLDRLQGAAATLGPRMTGRLEALRLLYEQVGGETPVMGWVEGALAEAADLRGVSELLVDLYDNSEWADELLEVCAGVAMTFAREQVAAGADIVGLGDAIASQISPAAYRRFALPYEQRIFAAVHQMGGLARLHICGDTTHLLSDMLQSGADIIDLDWMVDIGAAARLYGERVAICGNFDPVAVMYQGTSGDVRAAVRSCLARGGSRTISGAGCEIVDGTPHANLQAQAEALRDWPAS